MITMGELLSLCERAITQRTTEGLSWPLSLTLNDGSYLHAVRFREIASSTQGDAKPMRRLIGHDLERNALIDVSVDDLADASLTEGTWSEATLPPHVAVLEALARAAPEHKHKIVFLVAKSSPVAPVENEIAFCTVTLDPFSPVGNPLTSQEERIAMSMIDPDISVGSKVIVEYRENSRGHKKAIRIRRAPTDTQA